MSTHADKTSDTKTQAVVTGMPEGQSPEGPTLQLVDNRPQTVAQQKLQEGMNNSPITRQAAQLQAKADQHSAQQPLPVQRKENKTGLPDQLKAGIESLSGITMDDVKVHRNSDKPAALQAHAYAQGTDIHLAPGQEQHLPHEAWHVVQQKQGRVKPTMQLKGKVPVNDDEGLEREADLMGSKALQLRRTMAAQTLSGGSSTGTTVQQVLDPAKLNVVGEDHKISGPPEVRLSEENHAREVLKGKYWLEGHFPVSQDAADKEKPADTYMLQTQFALAVMKFHNDALARVANPPMDTVQERCKKMRKECNDIIIMGRKSKEVNEAEAVAWYAKHEQKVFILSAMLEVIIGGTDGGALNPALFIAESLDSMDAFPTWQDASMARAMAMHTAANKGAQAGVTGVWKIGDAHFDEIAAKTLPGDRLYTLTNADTYYQEYGTWMKARVAKRKADELAKEAAMEAAKTPVPVVDLSKHPDPTKTVGILSAADVDAADEESF